MSLKILVLTDLYPPDYIGGYECGCRQAVDALRDAGHDVRVLTTAPRTPVPHVPHVRRSWRMTDVWDRYMNGAARPVTVHLDQAESNMVNAFNVHALCREVEDFRPDVAYVWNLVGVGGIGVMAALQHLTVPWLWHLMDDIPVNLCRVGLRTIEPLRDEFSRQLAGDYVSCSRILIEEVERGGFGIAGRTEIVPNWVVGESPPPRERFYALGDTLRIAYAGQISDNKGVDLLIQGAGLLRDAGHDNFTVDIFGKVEDQAFPSLVRRLDLDGHIRFLGSRPQAELLEAYLHHDVFAFPTWSREPFGFAPLEAAWRGCLPLLSQTCGISEWLVHDVHCRKIRRSAEGVAEGLAAIARGDVELGPLARRAAKAIDRDFHIRAIVGRLERALGRAAARPRKPAGTAADAYRLALLAEKLAKVLIQEAA